MRPLVTSRSHNLQGPVALGILLPAELGVVVRVRGLSLHEYLATFGTSPGLVWRNASLRDARKSHPGQVIDTRDRHLAGGTLMLKRYGNRALEESAARANELALAGDDDRAATWRRIMSAVTELANKTPGQLVVKI